MMGHSPPIMNMWPVLERLTNAMAASWSHRNFRTERSLSSDARLAGYFTLFLGGCWLSWLLQFSTVRRLLPKFD